jgi:hypothetical protein
MEIDHIANLMETATAALADFHISTTTVGWIAQQDFCT